MSETHAVIISIVGTAQGGNVFGDELRALMDGLHKLIPEAMPTFVLAAQPASVTTHELLAPPEHKRYSPVIRTAEDDIITAAQMWHDKRPGAVEALHKAVEAWLRFPE